MQGVSCFCRTTLYALQYCITIMQSLISCLMRSIVACFLAWGPRAVGMMVGVMAALVEIVVVVVVVAMSATVYGQMVDTIMI